LDPNQNALSQKFLSSCEKLSLGHGVKMHVLQARWGDNTVILKTPKPIGSKIATMHLTGDDRYKRKLTKEEFIRDVSIDPLLSLSSSSSSITSVLPSSRPTSLCS